MSGLVLQTVSQRQRRRKHSFRQLPGGTISGSSTNPETIGRNRRRQNLQPLQAELERIRCNKANRISSRIRKLKKKPAWQQLPKTDQEAAIQAIRDGQEVRYRKDKKKVQEQYKLEVEGLEVEEDATQLPLGGPPYLNTISRTPTTPTSLDILSESGSTVFSNFSARGGGSSCGCELIEGEEIEERDQQKNTGGVSKSDQKRPDSLKARTMHSESLMKGGSLPKNNLEILIAALQQA